MGAQGRLTVLSVGLMVCAAVSGTGATSRTIGLQVVLQNDGVAPSELVTMAQRDVTRLFASIDIELTWVDDDSIGKARGVRIVKLTNWEPRDRAIGAAALGVTYTGEHGTKRAYVIWARVRRLAERTGVRLDSLLGVAIAHELGHLVLPNRSHAKRGLMRETWDANDLRSVSAGLFGFSRESGILIAQGLRSSVAVAGR